MCSLKSLIQQVVFYAKISRDDISFNTVPQSIPEGLRFLFVFPLTSNEKKTAWRWYACVKVICPEGHIELPIPSHSVGEN